MLFQHKKSFMIALTSLVIGGTSIGGAASAQEYRYPPADVLEQPQQQTAPAAKPAVTTQPARAAQARPMPYPAQRPPQPRFNPGAPAYGAPGPRPYGPPPGSRPPMPYGPPPMAGARPMGPGAVPPPPPAYGNPYNQGPYNPRSYDSSRPYNNPRAKNNGPFSSGPFNNTPFGGRNTPFGGGGPFDKMGFGPFNGDSAPWETFPFGGRDSFWSRKEFPIGEQNPADWFDPGDPREGLAIMWDDLISAPDELGTMPGGWYVPSVSVPNPVDLEDQLEQATKQIPDLIRVYD